MSKEPISIITTSDGSHSLYNSELKETYHSTHGARTESLYVFVKEGLELLVAKGTKEINILEVGFGTGLNALLVWDFALKHPELKIHFETLEPFPLSKEHYEQLNYLDAFSTEVSPDQFQQMHSCDWEFEHQLAGNFSFVKHQKELQRFQSERQFNLVFYDAFAPSKQSEMWDIATLTCTHNSMQGGGVLVTYCAQGRFKRNLAELGMEVETLKGPPGKKEMVRATKR